MNRTDKDIPLQGRWIAMIALLMAGFMNLIDVSIVNVAIPSLQEAFNANDSQIEWVVAIYILTFALFLLPAGRLGDVVGRRRMFILGVCVFTVASALCGMAGSIHALIGARILQGVGGAMMTPQTLAIVPALFAPKERGTAFALFGLSAGLATVTGPVLGGLLVSADVYGLGWRPIFLVNLPIGLIAIVAALKFVPKLPGQKGLEIDGVGIALGVLTVLLILFPLIEGRQLDWPMWIFGMLISSFPMLGLFIWWQRRRAAQGKAQLLPVTLFKDRNYMIGTVLVMLLFAGIPGFFFVLAIFLQVGNGLTPLQSGLTTMPFSIGVLIASIAAGRLGNRWPRLRISFGGGLLTVAMLAFPFLVPQILGDISPVSFIFPMLIAGLGLGTSVSPIFNAVLSQVNESDTGSASGALQSFQQLGGALGLAVMGQLFFAHVAAKEPTATNLVPVYSDALSMALWFATASFACMSILVWRLKEAHQPNGLNQSDNSTPA